MTARLRSEVFPNATLQQFRELFQPKQQYRAAIGEMSVKERLIDWKPTTDLEAAFRSHIIDRALVKRGAGVMKVTTYRLTDQPHECKAYMSFGGKGLRLTAEGREGDVGFFLTATQTPDGLTVAVQSKREHYRNRTRLTNAFWVVVGLFLGILPGLIILAIILFVEPRQVSGQIQRVLWPPLTKFLGAKR